MLTCSRKHACIKGSVRHRFKHTCCFSRSFVVSSSTMAPHRSVNDPSPLQARLKPRTPVAELLLRDTQSEWRLLRAAVSPLQLTKATQRQQCKV